MKNWFIAILSIMLFFSCTDKDVVTSEEEGSQATVNEIIVTKGTRAYSTADDNNDILTKENFFNEKSILYVSQLGTTEGTNFPINYTSTSEIENNLYPYQWYENLKNPKWDEEYNFNPVNPDNVINWSVIKEKGSVGNAFSLYAMYFPIDPKIRFSVEEDQTGGDSDPYNTSKFLMSDIMGAYHATSSLYTRLRFRLFHLMVYLKVTLYVPVLADFLSDDHTISSFSGYDFGALEDARVLNANTDFSIEWRANRSSDTEAPLTQPTGDKKDIIMYCHKYDKDEDKTICLDVSKYYTGNFVGVCKCKKEGGVPCDDCNGECCKEGGNPSACKCDEVRIYNFSVLFPAQDFGKNNILRFQLKDKDNSTRNYYFSGSQVIGGENENYSLTQGTLQHLYLYLPRTTNETILIGAKKLPWDNAFTDMTVTQEGKNDDEEQDDSNDQHLNGND